MARRSPSRTRSFPARILAVSALLWPAACIPPVDLISEDSGVSPEDGVIVAFGVGVEVKEVDA